MDLFLFADTSGSSNLSWRVSTAHQAWDPWCNVPWYQPNATDDPDPSSPTSSLPHHQHSFTDVFSHERGPPHAPSPTLM
jgi:hypothetical protein